MEKEFVPYELAVKLKALGFDEPCFGYYLTKDLPYVKRGLKFGSEKYIGKHNSYDDFIVSTPTFSQAFRWFRENYNWTIKVNQVTKNNWSYTINNYPKERQYYGEVYESFEVAEIACLDKLIEIVESKSE